MKLIPLIQGKFTEVSDHRFDFLNQWKWCLSSNGYAVRNIRINGKYKTLLMHLVIHPSPEGFETDHEDTNRLNNQDYNLRTVTHKQNMFNMKLQKGGSSKYKGVNWVKERKKWRSRIKFNGVEKFLGRFNCEIKAAKAYDLAALKYFGEFAKLNFQI